MMIRALIIALSQAAMYAGGSIGVVRVDDKQATLLSEQHLKKETKTRIYRLGTWAEKAVVTIEDGVMNDNSSLYNSNGENSNWEYGLHSDSQLPVNTIWLSFPMSWVIEPIDSNHARVILSKKCKGDLVISKGAEGINIDMQIGKNSRHIYYSLGYDIK